MDLTMIALGVANGRSVARVREWRWCPSGNGTRGGSASPRIRLEWLHRRDRRHGSEQSLPARPRARPHLSAFLLVEQRPGIVDGLCGNVEDQAVARLAEDIAPVVARRPQLRVLEGKSH